MDKSDDLASLDLSMEPVSALPRTIDEPLRSADVGLRLIRGGTVRVTGYGLMFNRWQTVRAAPTRRRAISS